MVHLLALRKHGVISADAALTEVHEHVQYVDMEFYTGENNVRTSSALKLTQAVAWDVYVSACTLNV